MSWTCKPNKSFLSKLLLVRVLYHNNRDETQANCDEQSLRPGGGGGRGSTVVEHCPNHHPPLALQKVKTNQPKRAKSQFHRHFAINVFNQHCFFHSLNRCINIVYINHIRYSLICFHLHIFMYYYMVFIIVAPTPKYKINFLKI